MKLLFSPFSLFLFLFSLSHASELTMGDLNGDGEVNLIDTVLMVNHIQGTEYITDSDALKWKADVNGDGLVNSFDVEESLNFVFKREPKKQMPKTSVLATSPYHGEGNIALTREFVVRFTMPLKEGTVITDDSFYAHSAGDLMITSARLSSDRMKATLFLGGFRWPSNSKVTVTFRGTGLTDFLDRELDLDGDGSPGGHGEWTFSTLAVEASDPSTVVKGRVLDSDNSNGERPLGGVIISVVGNEEQFTTLSDVNGYFTLTSAPVGRFFVVVDGRLVGAGAGETLADDLWKERDYYTFVGKAWEGVPGKEVNATKYGKYDDSGAYQPSPKDGNIYLPLVKKGALQSVNSSTDTEIAFATGYLEEASPEQAAMLHATSITIPPGSLQADDGTQGGSVGIAPVDPERLPEPLPESLAMPLVITIQTDGASNFDVPVPARFPNVDNLPPGTKSALWSFDHDTGVWEISGPMTVSEDGKYLETDPGVGIRQPGWHGASPGAQVFGTAVITGPTISKPTPGACGLTQEQMELTEQEFTDLGRLSEGIEETIFGANDEDISFSKEILSAGHHFAKGSANGGKNWDLFRNHVYRDASLHQEIASKAVQLLGNDSFWAAFISTAGVMKDNALIAMIDQSKRDQINQAHLTFLQKHTVAKEQITKQLNKWEKYLQSVGALLGETSLVINYSTIQGNRGELGRTISLVSKAFRALPGGRKRLDSCLKRYAKDWQNFIESTLDGNLHAYKGESFVFLKRIGSDKEENRLPPIAAQRIRVGTGGAYDAIVRPNSWYEAWMLEPTTLVIGCTTFISPRNGGNGPVPPIPLCKDDKPDSDYDYLSDRGERVVGTHSQQSDTDGDGIPDGFEIMNGTDPSGGNPVFTGILATIPTPDRVFSDSIVTGNDLAILGNGPHGIEIFDIGAGVRPIKLAGIDTPGSVRRAALSGNFLAIADAGAGLTVVDLSNPEVPSIRFNLKQESPANAVAVYGGVAFVGLENGTIHSFDLFSGQPIDQVSPGQLVEDLGILGRHLIVLTHKNRQHSMLHSIPFVNGRFADDDGEFARVDPVNTPGFRQWGLGNGLGRRLFVGDEFAYVTDLMGFTHFDLSDHSTPG